MRFAGWLTMGCIAGALASCGPAPQSRHDDLYDGMVAVGRINQDGKIAFSATAVWLTVPFAWDADAAHAGDGKCRTLDPDPAYSASTRDAGEVLTLAPPASAQMAMPPLSSGLRVYGALAAPEVFVGDATYDVLGPGGQEVAPFAVKVETPGDFRLTAPPVDGTATISKRDGLDFAWQTFGSKDPVVVEIAQTDLDTGAVVAKLRCSFPDEGSARVPPDVLEGFARNADSPALQTTFEISKVRMTEQPIPGGGRTVILGSSGSRGLASIID